MVYKYKGGNYYDFLNKIGYSKEGGFNMQMH